MKRILPFILMLAMMSTLVGCGAEAPNPPEAPGTPEVSVQESAEPVKGTEAPVPTETPDVPEASETPEPPVQESAELTEDDEEIDLDDLTPMELAQGTYQVLNALASDVDTVGSDICKAWKIAIWEEDSVVNGGAEYLAGKLVLSEDELREGIAHMAFSKTDGDWASISDEQWAELRQKDSLFAEAQKEDGLFDFCIDTVWCAYLEIGAYEIMDEGMSQVKEVIRELQERDPENPYVEPLKEYYGVIRSYLEWCKSPDGSYTDAEELLNTYEDSYRSYRDSLEFDLGE